MMHLTRFVFLSIFIIANMGVPEASAHGVVSKIVNAPLTATGTVKGARIGVNVYLQKPNALGIEFMDPKVQGYGIEPGGRLEVELGGGFKRLFDVPLAQSAIMLVTGAPQQGLPGKKVGYTVSEGANDRTFVFTPTSKNGIPSGKMMSPAPGSKMDPIRQKGIKVLHIGFLETAFENKGDSRGTVAVRFIDGTGKAIQEGIGSVGFLNAPVPQILPTNFPDKRRNHNWQRIKSGQTLGQTEGTVPVTLMMYAKASGLASELHKFKSGIAGAGVLSTPQLKKMGYTKPVSLKRYNGGLIVQDTDGNGALDPNKDRIIGGVIGKAPKGAKGMELRSLEKEGKSQLSQPTEKMAPKPGKRWGGSIMLLQFTGGSKSGKYRPTLALLRDPGNLNSGDGSKYTYTVVVE
ncbi:MAG: hypothetical protein V3R37_00085 [Rhodospirillales bacterium]